MSQGTGAPSRGTPEPGLYERVDSRRARELLGWRPREIEAAIVEMAESLIVVGPLDTERRELDPDQLRAHRVLLAAAAVLRAAVKRRGSEPRCWG